jgi:dephospho-CoA kinase
LAPRIIGLLGGLGSGKSAVAALFRELGARVLDADAIARSHLETPEVRKELEAAFGPGLLDREGRVDRARLAARVFRDPEAKRRLEQLIHPKVLEEMKGAIERIGREEPGARIVLDVPLLRESGLDRRCDVLVFVAADPETRWRRAEARSGWDPEEARRREAQQAPLEEKRRSAHFVIDNDGSLDRTRERVREIWEQLGTQRE